MARVALALYALLCVCLIVSARGRPTSAGLWRGPLQDTQKLNAASSGAVEDAPHSFMDMSSAGWRWAHNYAVVRPPSGEAISLVLLYGNEGGLVLLRGYQGQNTDYLAMELPLLVNTSAPNGGTQPSIAVLDSSLAVVCGDGQVLHTTQCIMIDVVAVKVESTLILPGGHSGGVWKGDDGVFITGGTRLFTLDTRNTKITVSNSIPLVSDNEAEDITWWATEEVPYFFDDNTYVFVSYLNKTDAWGSLVSTRSSSPVRWRAPLATIRGFAYDDVRNEIMIVGSDSPSCIKWITVADGALQRTKCVNNAIAGMIASNSWVYVDSLSEIVAIHGESIIWSVPINSNEPLKVVAMSLVPDHMLIHAPFQNGTAIGYDPVSGKKYVAAGPYEHPINGMWQVGAQWKMQVTGDPPAFVSFCTQDCT